MTRYTLKLANGKSSDKSGPKTRIVEVKDVRKDKTKQGKLVIVPRTTPRPIERIPTKNGKRGAFT